MGGFPAAFAVGLGSAAGSIGGSVVSGLFNLKGADKTTQRQKEIAEATDATNERIAQANLDFQRENFDYQKALQNQIFEREDTAYQRTVDDMRAAGLSPLSMQNTNGAGSVVPTEALHNDFQAQGYDVESTVGAFDSFATAMNQISDQIFNRDALRAQARKTNAEAENIEINNKFAEALAAANLDKSIFEKELFGEDLFKKRRQNDYEDYFGINEGMTENERIGAILSRSLGFDFKSQNYSNDYRFENKNGSFGSFRADSDDLQRLGMFVSGINALSGLSNFLPAKDIFALARGFGKSGAKFKKIDKKAYQDYLDDILPF